MATISTHNGSQVNQLHNCRNFKTVKNEKHIDLNGVHENWVHVPVRQAYHQLFDEALKEYNAKQTRKDRRISNYYNKVKADEKMHPAYEMIIGVYGVKNEELTKCILKDFVKGWQERNPNLKMIGAYYHNDEKGESGHCHIDYVPVAHGYTKGLKTQAGLVKALGEMGFEKNSKETAQIQWERRENKHLEELCLARGITVEHPKTGLKHVGKDLYIKVQEELKAYQEASARLYEQVVSLQEQVNSMQEQVRRYDELKMSAKKTFGNSYKLDKQAFESLLATVQKAEYIINQYDDFKSRLDLKNRDIEYLEQQLAESKHEASRLRFKFLEIEDLTNKYKLALQEVPELKKWEQEHKQMKMRSHRIR